MSTNLSSVDLSDSPEESEATPSTSPTPPTPPKPRRSRWVGVLVFVAIVVLCGIGLMLFERQILTERVADLEALLEESRDETRAVAAHLAREATRVEDLRSTMGEINDVSAELVQKLTSLRVLTSDALANSSLTDESAPAEAPEPTLVEEVEAIEAVEAVEESTVDDAVAPIEEAVEEPSVDPVVPTPERRRGTPAIGVMRPISPPDFR